MISRTLVSLCWVAATLVVSACAPEDALEVLDGDGKQLDVTGTSRRARAEAIRDVAASQGLTNGVLLAGIAQVESSLTHCWSEAKWACQGPYSVSCGGPVIAGAADGPCDAQQGGLGMFQFDGGTYLQTLARDGQDILQLDGNIAHAVEFVVAMTQRGIAGIDTPAQALRWLNAVPVVANDPVFAQWNELLACRYNGRCSARQAAKYANATLALLSELGAAFWDELP